MAARSPARAPLRVAMLARSFPSLGETFVYNLAARVAATEVDVTVLTQDWKNDAATYDCGSTPSFGGRTAWAPIGRRPSAWAARARAVPGLAVVGPSAARQLGWSKATVRTSLLAASLARYDVVHFQFSSIAVAYVDALPLLPGTATLVSCRGGTEQLKPLLSERYRQALRATFERVDRVHCVSGDLRRRFEEYGLVDAKTFVRHPAVDTRYFRRTNPYRPSREGTLELLSVGRLYWAKGFEYALLAVAELVRRGCNVHYRIVGAGPDEPRLRLAIEDLGLARHVSLAGARTTAGVRASLESADVFVLPSVNEGLSNAALEAMAMELPLVTTDAGGMTEGVTHAKDALVVPTRDPVALAEAIVELVRRPELRRTLGEAARRTVVDRFDDEARAARFVEVYEELGELARARRSPSAGA